MPTSAGIIVRSASNNNISAKPTVLTSGYEGLVVSNFNFGAFNATTNPNGIQSLTTTDFIIAAQVGQSLSEANARNTITGFIKINSVRITPSAALTLGTANNFTLRLNRRAGSSLPPVILGTITEASLTANALVGVVDINLFAEAGDSIVLVPDGAIDGTAVPGTNINVTVAFTRLTNGGRLVAARAVA